MIRRRDYAKMLLLFGAIFLGSFAYSQESIGADKLSKEWSLLTTQNGVEVYLRKDFCDVGAKDLFTYAHLKFVNTTSNQVSVDFNYELIHENGCVGCGSTDEYHKSVVVGASSSLEGDCVETPELSLLINNPYQKGLGKIESVKVVQLIIK